MPVSYQNPKIGCDVHREDNASTIIKAYNNTSALPYTLHYVGRAANDGMHLLEYSSSRCGLQITLCLRFQTTRLRGHIPASNARLLTYAKPTLAPETVS